MPPRTTSSAATSYMSIAMLIVSVSLAHAFIPPESELVEGRRNQLSTDSDLPLVISAPEASNKRKTRKSVDVTIVKPDPSPDALPLLKKKHVHSPASVTKATEEDNAIEEDDAASSKAAMMDDKDASGHSKSKNSQGTNTKALSSLSDGKPSDSDAIKIISFKPSLEGDRLSNDSDESLPETPTKLRGSTAKTTKISLTNNSNSDSIPITPQKARDLITKGAKCVPVGSSEDDDEPLGVDQWPATPKAKGKLTVSASRSNNIGPHDSDELLYPTEFNVPADSDYDDQDQDAFEPVDTELMPTSLQDPKLRFDYMRLPDMPYIEMQPFQHYSEHAAEHYSLVWAALKDERDELVR
ncbi:hypothetical protein APHAL10511_005549, partial [Amanita phalloides]